MRLWFDVLAALPGVLPGTILAALGSAAILFGSVLALRQARLKLLIAYSTVAQIGYLFLMFPLGLRRIRGRRTAWSGGIMQALSHAFAKAAMFLSAGLIAESLGHDRIADLGGAGRAMPVTFLALGLGGLSLMGLPPSGGFAAKWLLMQASIEAGQWVWAVVMLAADCSPAAISTGCSPSAGGRQRGIAEGAPRRSRESVALALALVAAAARFAPPSFFAFLQIGRPPRTSRSNERAHRTVRAQPAGRDARRAARRSGRLPVPRCRGAGARDHAARRTACARRRRARDWRRAVRRPSCPRCA